ncbi:MAG: hypothetical protein Q9M17_01740 [Mariprofundus sp.]|nr:hypothetical protein [Mariprofundus sp.]
MTAKLRTAIGVCAVVLALIVLLWVRLDADALNTRLSEHMSHYANASMQSEKTAVTFMHGIGLRLDQVKLDHPDFQLQAKHINISLRLLPLLMGQIKVDTLDMHDALFKLKSNAVDLSATFISRLPVERIHLIRSTVEAPDGTPLLSNLQLELRGLGTERETLWEFNAQKEKQAVSGHGRILFHQGHIESGFGKIKLANLPVAKLSAFAPTSLMHWIEGEGNNLSGSVTMDISKHQTWALFGEMMLENEPNKLAVKLRGKLSHLSDGKLEWKDSFIHLDGQAVIAIVGSCEHNNCSTTLDAKNIELMRWHPFIPKGVTFHRDISGTTQLMASLQWNEKTWQGQAALELNDASFQYDDQTIALPPLHLDVYELSGSTTTWNAKSHISSSNVTGTINVLSDQKENGDKNLELETHDSDSVLWQPLSNLLLSSLGLKPVLQASGSIQGSVHLHQHEKKKTLELNIDATPAHINYQPWGNKAANVVALCQVDITISDHKPSAINMNRCQLDASSITGLNWSEKKEQHALSIETLKLDFDSLKKQSIAVPASMQDITGQLTGSGSSHWKAPQHWTANLRGSFQLQHIGTQDWHSDGEVQIDKGTFSSEHLLVDGIFGKASLQGSFNQDSQRGDIDIISGTLDWSSLPPLSSPLLQIYLRGEIKQAELTLLHNQWHNIRSVYSLSQGALTLKKLQSAFAAGTLTSKQIVFSPTPDGLQIQGDILGQNIQLDQVQGLNDWMQADISGSLQANIILKGLITSTIPERNWQDTWRRSNGDILIYSGNWKQHKKAESLSVRLGFKSPSLTHAYAYKKLEFRFRVFEKKADISGISLLSHEQSFQGKASINSDSDLTGIIQNNTDQSRWLLESPLPQILWRQE